MTAAALVSTVTYTIVFLVTLVAYKMVLGRPWRWFLLTAARLRAIAR